MSEPILRLEGAVKEHPSGAGPVTALGGVDLEVEGGEMVAITGRSGSGKSTLLNISGGLDQVTSGSVHVAGVLLSGMSAAESAELRRRHVGYVFQNLNLLASLTATENVSLPMEFDGIKPSHAAVAAREALARVGIEQLAGRFPDELSGGERQRVAIARGIAGPRKLVLADEPTGALDEMTGRGVMDLLSSLSAEGAAVLVVTHDSELAAYADRIVRLRDGLVDSVIQRPAIPASAAELLS